MWHSECEFVPGWRVAVVEVTDEEVEEEAEADEEVHEEEAAEDAAKPLPGLGDPSDLMLVEKWHAVFVGNRMEVAATSGHVVCTRSELACYVKIAVPPGCPDVRTPLIPPDLCHCSCPGLLHMPVPTSLVWTVWLEESNAQCDLVAWEPGELRLDHLDRSPRIVTDLARPGCHTV